MTDGLDSRYATFREQSELAERVTKLEASLMHLPSDVAELRRKLDALAPKLDALNVKLDEIKRAPQDNQGALALHHLADAFAKAKPNQQPGLLLVTAAIGCMAIGGWLTKFLGLGA